MKQISNCCKAEVKIGGDNEEGTHYYICSSCLNPCDLYVENEIVSEYENMSENEKLLRALCNECYELGEQQSHRMYNPHNFKVVLERLNTPNEDIKEYKEKIINNIKSILLPEEKVEQILLTTHSLNKIIEIINNK